MAFLFDTDAISELLRPRPFPDYVMWLQSVPREDQYTSAIVIGELYQGAFHSAARERHLHNIEQRILPVVTVLPYDVAIAKTFGRIRAQLAKDGMMLADADIQIAATAIYHGLELVTGNLKHFQRIPELRIQSILADLKADQPPLTSLLEAP